MHLKDRHVFAINDEENLSRPLVIALGMNRRPDRTILGAFRIIHVDSPADISHHLTHEDVAVLLMGADLTANEALAILEQLASELPASRMATIALCAGTEAALFQKFIDDGRLFYLARGEITESQLEVLLACAADGSQAVRRVGQDSLANNIANIDLLLDFCIRLPMQADLAAAGKLTVETARSLIDAEQAQCLIHDPEEDVLISTDDIGHQGWPESAATGLAGFAVRTGEGILLDHADADPRYDCGTDNPCELEHARFLAEPIFGFQNSVAGVITAVRNGECAPFSAEDRRMLQRIAECSFPTFSQILLQNRVQKLLTKRSESHLQVFREEALEHHMRNWNHHGDVLKTLPRWLRGTYWIVLAFVLVAIAAMFGGRLNEYADGPAIIRQSDATNAASSDLLPKNAAYEVIAFLPERYASKLQRGMPIRLIWNNDSDTAQHLHIDFVGAPTLTPFEAAQYAGKDITDLFSGAGRVVAVRAYSASPGLGGAYPDGMTGQAEVMVGSEPIIFSLVPSIKRIWGKVP